MAIITWGGNTGSWLAPADWLEASPGAPASVPGAQDTALFQPGGISTATVDGFVQLGGATLAPGDGVTLLIDSTLDLLGTLDALGGTLSLAPGGTIEGGTVEFSGGALIGQGGVADGVAWLGPLGRGLAITPATALDTEGAVGTLAITGTVTLENGTYTGARFGAETFVRGAAEIDAAGGGTVTLDAGSTVAASADDPGHDPGTTPAYAGLMLGGAGSFTSQGTITSDLSSLYAPLTIATAEFTNLGSIALAPATIPDEQATFYVTMGALWPQPLTLTYDEVLTAGLVLSSAVFANAGSITGYAAQLIVQSSAFSNSGTIVLGGETAQVPVANTQTAYLTTTVLGSSIDITGSVTAFSNTGVIAAATVEFDDNLTLAQLGTVHAALLFTGTLDLGGGTLDLALTDPGQNVTFTGTVRNGTIVADSGTLVTAGATLQNVTVLQQQTGALVNVVSGGVILDASTTDLDYTTASYIASLALTAGAPDVTDHIELLAPGEVTFGPQTSIFDTVPGAILAVQGGGTFAENGTALVGVGSTLGFATLDGSGTVTLAGHATLAVGDLAPSSAVNVVFQGTGNLLLLPASGASGVNLIGLNLSGLTSGDTIDFADVSSTPILGAPFGAGGAGLSGGLLQVQGASGEAARIAFAGAAGISFNVAPDPTGGTLVTVACFRNGTRIATPSGEVPVEHLRIGDLVTTRTGAARRIRWLGRRALAAALVAAQPQLRPVRIAPDALGPGRPRRPLFLSALHGLLLADPDGGEALVPAASLVGCRGITRARPGAVAYVHIELDSPDIVLADGAAAESFVDRDSRALFDNVAEHAALYGDRPAPTRRWPAPRIEEGWRLHAIRGALPGGDRGIAAPGTEPRWAIDHACDRRIEGWAIDEAQPGAPVALALLDAGVRRGCFLANRYRIDLDHAGIAAGACAFSIPVPHGASGPLDLRTIAGRALLHP